MGGKTGSYLARESVLDDIREIVHILWNVVCGIGSWFILRGATGNIYNIIYKYLDGMDGTRR